MLPAGIGILNRSRSWLAFTVFMLWLTVIVVPFLALSMTLMSANADVHTSWTIFGQPVSHPALKLLIVLLIGAMYTLCIWMLRVLKDPNTRAHFDRRP